LLDLDDHAAGLRFLIRDRTRAVQHGVRTRSWQRLAAGVVVFFPGGVGVISYSTVPGLRPTRLALMFRSSPAIAIVVIGDQRGEVVDACLAGAA
jgi:hypothetical protein